jgi:hypothetical protein
MQVREEFPSDGAEIPYDARPSLSAAASAAVTRNVELLSGL